jgi:putative Ca2+/H+ antiporter (TMEM165/GDT1 family)
MEVKMFFTVFLTVFIAELGDKTQLATMLYASDKEISKWMVFFAASAALILASGLGVVAGQWLSQHINERQLSIAAGVGFIAIGLWSIWR